MSELFFTMDVEDPDQDRDGSFVPPLLAVLDWLKQEERVGTFFIVGELAERYPQAVRRIAADGHEIGLHGWRHTDIQQLGENRFLRQTQRGKEVLENLLGGPIAGYRAPMFSLTANTPWAEQILFELGFLYSSSVLPVPNPRFCFPGQPQELFTWPSGLYELPSPVTHLYYDLPFLGGIYFRYLPNWLIRLAMHRMDSSQVPWFYCHPYDFYWDKAFVRMRDTPLWVNFLLMGRRRHAMRKMQQFFKDFRTSRSLSEYVRSHTAYTAPTGPSQRVT